MSEKLIIKNFGPIKNVELDLGRFSIIIGENATGKSTVAKVLAMCRYFSYILPADTIINNPFEEGLFNRGLTEFIKDNTYIFYECKHYTFTADHVLQKVKESDSDGDVSEIEMPILYTTLTPLSNEFKFLLEQLESIKPKPKEKNVIDLTVFGWSIPYSFFLNDVAKVMDNPFYLYTERGLQSIFSLGKNSIQNISDSLFIQFAGLDKISRLFKNDTIIEPLDITYKNVDGKGYIKKSNEENFYNLNNGASGYKSAIPIVLMVKYYTESKFNKKNKTFIIEEPELNLFPKAQQKLMQFLVDKTMNYGNTTLLTTHSPYILTSFNNLMYAYQIGQGYSADVEKIVEKKYWLNPAEVSAYMMLTDGTCEIIIDKEEGLIKAEKIDSVSGFLNEQFDALINIELIEK